MSAKGRWLLFTLFKALLLAQGERSLRRRQEVGVLWCRRKLCSSPFSISVWTGIGVQKPSDKFPSRTHCYSDMGISRVLGIPIPKTLRYGLPHVTLTLTLTKNRYAIWEGDAHITRVMGMGMPYHCNTASNLLTCDQAVLLPFCFSL